MLGSANAFSTRVKIIAFMHSFEETRKTVTAHMVGHRAGRRREEGVHQRRISLFVNIRGGVVVVGYAAVRWLLRERQVLVCHASKPWEAHWRRVIAGP